MVTKTKPKDRGWSGEWSTIVHAVSEQTTEETITAKGTLTEGMSVKTNLGKDRVRKLTINLSGGKPDYEFDGYWSGSDILIIQRGLSRAYRLHTRELRRENKAIYTIQEGTK